VIRVLSNATELAHAVTAYGGDATKIMLRGFRAWASLTNNMLRLEAERPVKGGLKATATMAGASPMAVFECASLIGLWREQGTGLFGPQHARITSKGGMYLGPRPLYLGPQRKSGAKVTGVGAERPLRTRSMLRFEIDGEVFYRYSVAGRHADPWFWKTISECIERPGRGLVAILHDALRIEWDRLRTKAGARWQR
jgi:hypothetical protein